jgi:hypothetical protein
MTRMLLGFGVFVQDIFSTSLKCHDISHFSILYRGRSVKMVEVARSRTDKFICRGYLIGRRKYFQNT